VRRQLGPGDKASNLTVEDLSGKTHTFQTAGTLTVVTFISAVCPISNEYNDRMSALYRNYSSKGVRFLFVNSNSNESVGAITEHRKAAEFPFPVYRDPGNQLADRLGAMVTPQSFVFDSKGVLQYRGQIDDARNPARVQFEGVRTAIDQLQAGQPVARRETKAFGCTIKRIRKAS
jgi:hypothetical protein